jgi:hypothetical protein
MQFLASQEEEEPRVVWRSSPLVVRPRPRPPGSQQTGPAGGSSASGATPGSPSKGSSCARSLEEPGGSSNSGARPP